jgi:hypothetical protein
MPVSYGVLEEFRVTGVWNGSAPRRWWIYGPVFAALLAERWWRRRIR